MPSFYRCRLGIIQRSRGGSAVRRSAYQACQRMQAPNGLVFDYSKNRDSHGHVQTIVIAPPGSPPWVQEPHTLWLKAVSAERRRDAQEARTIEISLPRSLPRDLWEGCVRTIVAPFVAVGMVVQADIHAPPAADDDPNPHVHLVGTMRRIENDGFSSHKARDWNAMFLGQAKKIRMQIAEILNAFCAQHDIDYRADPRSNLERGLPAPEVTLPRWNIEMANRTGRRTKWMMVRDAERTARHQLAALESTLESIDEAIRVEQVNLRRRISNPALAPFVMTAARQRDLLRQPTAAVLAARKRRSGERDQLQNEDIAQEALGLEPVPWHP
ncbi:MAG: MobA/MobL family protein [Pseudolabrys sp.]